MFPKIDLQHKEDTLTYEIVVPGFSKDNLDLSVRSKTIFLKGENGRTTDTKYITDPSTPSNFSINLPLPGNAKLAESEIRLADGILYVPVKLDERKKIAIQ